MARKIILAVESEIEIVECKECGADMVNIDAKQLRPGDLSELKKKKVRISNPFTQEPICVNCDLEKRPSIRKRLVDFFESDDDDDDSGFFGTSVPSPISSPISVPSPSPSPSFGGFGGGIFSGGGAGRGF